MIPLKIDHVYEKNNMQGSGLQEKRDFLREEEYILASVEHVC